MKHQFSEVPRAEIPRSSFDRSHVYKTTFDAGWLIPFFVDEALPGDTFSYRLQGFARLATPIHPVMDNMFMETHFFAVPHRLLWDNWEKFCGSQDNPADSTDFTIPIVSSLSSGYLEQTIFDYMGLPTKIGNYGHNALPLRAYNLIYNEWFRDENLQDSVTENTGNGPDAYGDYVLRRRGKRHDYFTSCLPWPQKGDSVDIPLGTQADVHTAADTTEFIGVYSDATADHQRMDSVAAGVRVLATTTDAETNRLYADLSNATAATINQLRQAFQIQKILERDARGGTRYTELIKAHFGVTSPDARLQRPEFLGGGKSPVHVQQVPQTSESATTAQGNLAAYGTAHIDNHGFTKSFTEHCVLIGIVSVRADLTYQQGLNRMWSRSTRYDYYWPALAHIGEQAVLSKEIYADASANDNDVFGYQERFAEYRYKPSMITGLFRSNATGTLDPWHLSQDFSSRPVLGDTFIQDNPPIDRAIAVPAEPHFLFDSHATMRCARPMPLYGVPGSIDRL